MQVASGGAQAVVSQLDAARAAVDRGALFEAIGHCEAAKAQCLQIADTPAPPAKVAPDEALDIRAASALTGYSVSRLRHMGHTLAGFKKWHGKVTWSRRLLEAELQNTGRRRPR